MAPNEARRRARELAGLADELSIRLRVLEELSPALPVRVDVRLVGRGGRNLGSGTDADIEALSFIVLMEAAKSTQDDLKAILAHIKAINAARDGLRSYLEKADAGGPTTSRAKSPMNGSADLDAVLEVMLTAYGIVIEQEGQRLINDLDSMSQIGELESLRLQLAMDRMSKMMSTLSNVLKKIADTSQQLVQNMK